MDVTVVTAPNGSYLRAVRAALNAADQALVCVAFAQARGVHLVADELSAAARRGSARVLVTTSLGTSSPAALSALADYRADVRVLNPGGATYHPKVFIGRTGDAVQAVVGSANLTSGLVANVEAGTALHGSMHEQPITELWSWAERLWQDPRALPWRPPPEAPIDEAIEPELLAQLAAVAQHIRPSTRSGPHPNPTSFAT